YGLAGVGLVLTYKTSGIFNFAHGSIATVAAFTFFALHVDPLHIPWPYAAAICTFVLGPAIGLVFTAFARLIGDVETKYQVVATVGIVLSVQSAMVFWRGSNLTLF